MRGRKKKTKTRSARIVLAVAAALAFAAAPAGAEDPAPATAEAAAANANNPLANMVALNVQNYYVPSLYGADESANTAWLRYALGRFLLRASLPGFGVGKVVRSGNTVFNMFIEPQYTVLHDGVGQPEFQILAALNLQFVRK
jgi:hypothetical protein